MPELFVTLVVPLIAVAVCAWFRFNPRPNLNLLPTLCLGVVLVDAVFGHDFFHVKVGPLPITLDRILLGVAFLYFAWRFLTGRENLEALNRLDWAVLLWLAVITVSTMTADYKFNDNMPLSRLLFFNWLPVVLYFICRHSRFSIADFKFMSVVMGAFGLYLALTAIMETRGLEAYVFPRYIMTSDVVEFLGRGRGPFLNPVANGTYQAICFCCVLVWWPRSNQSTKFWLVACALVISIGVYATLTRSVWLSLIAACGCFIFMPAPQRAKGAMVVAATLVSIIMFPTISEKVLSFKRDKNVSVADMEQSAQLRPLFAIVAYNMFQDRPIAGVGFGQYSRAKYPYLKDPNTGKPLTLTRPFMQHNVFLAYVTESGLIGLAVLMFLLFQCLRVTWRVWSNQETHLVARQLGLLGLVLLSCYTINGMFHDVSIVPKMHVLLMFLFGMINNVYSRASSFSINAVAARPEEESVRFRVLPSYQPA